MTRHLLLALILQVLVLPVLAQSNCGDHDQIIGSLGQRCGEALVGKGLHANGGLIELLVNSETGTWTILGTVPGGPTCLLGAGENWEIEAPKAEGDPA